MLTAQILKLTKVALFKMLGNLPLQKRQGAKYKIRKTKSVYEFENLTDLHKQYFKDKIMHFQTTIVVRGKLQSQAPVYVLLNKK